MQKSMQYSLDHALTIISLLKIIDISTIKKIEYEVAGSRGRFFLFSFNGN